MPRNSFLLAKAYLVLLDLVRFGQQEVRLAVGTIWPYFSLFGDKSRSKRKLRLHILTRKNTLPFREVKNEGVILTVVIILWVRTSLKQVYAVHVPCIFLKLGAEAINDIGILEMVLPRVHADKFP